MEEVVFKALLFNTKFTRIENFIQEVLDSNNDITYEDVKESILKLVLYRFIKVDNNLSPENCILKEANFYEAQRLGGVNSWLEKKRAVA
ncbi:hypothetical protein DS884_11720 [Tenacibaculum sp. E3R01]|uniref:hypothetical protein n=1 Tax=unclassified Tenacibaculum TaxID=2635139 RepID=UPI00089B9296|nr:MULTISPECIES: hypothetical protein [unclassified Tenacibaculum]RBW57243.1 hypothetical protein DS884_11720 [Tenacibaculum sp. E3R01]SEE25632.1 hypothetical protein SAMN04487765_1917 [Tenacibaculum sp. MAR_2010_89]